MYTVAWGAQERDTNIYTLVDFVITKHSVQYTNVVVGFAQGPNHFCGGSW